MTRLIDIGLDPQELRRRIDNGWITERNHPTLPLRILNYSASVQFTRGWDDYTIACRGLIIDQDDNVVARPWRKFWNLGDGYDEPDWNSPVEVTDKMDGSLGILWATDHDQGISTRGSFESDQAIHATQKVLPKYACCLNWPVAREYTFLFEIVYPANRIVVNYGDLDDLVLLGAVHIEHGYYLGPNEAAALLWWPGLVTQVFEYRTLQEAFSAQPRPNAEGYVVRSGNTLVKIKQVDYVELHRIVTNLNARTVWDRLGSGETVASLCEQVPDEFHEFVKETAAGLFAKQEEILDRAVAEYVRVCALAASKDGMFTRKEFAQAASKSPDKAYLFKLLDGKPIDSLVWASLKPDASKE